MVITGLTLKNGRLVEAKTRSKFNVKRDDPRRVYDGVKYDSAAEARFAAELDARKAAGEIVALSRQVDIKLSIDGKLICKLRADFYVVYPDGRSEYIEVKGVETDIWRLKVKLLRALHPEIAYRVIAARAVAGRAAGSSGSATG
jgi:hypothetical protein